MLTLTRHLIIQIVANCFELDRNRTSFIRLHCRNLMQNLRDWLNQISFWFFQKLIDIWYPTVVMKWRSIILIKFIHCIITNQNYCIPIEELAYVIITLFFFFHFFFTIKMSTISFLLVTTTCYFPLCEYQNLLRTSFSV